MATKKKDYDQKKYYDAQTEGMFFGGFAKDMTSEQKKKMKEVMMKGINSRIQFTIVIL